MVKKVKKNQINVKEKRWRRICLGNNVLTGTYRFGQCSGHGSQVKSQNRQTRRGDDDGTKKAYYGPDASHYQKTVLETDRLGIGEPGYVRSWGMSFSVSAVNRSLNSGQGVCH